MQFLAWTSEEYALDLNSELFCHQVLNFNQILDKDFENYSEHGTDFFEIGNYITLAIDKLWNRLYARVTLLPEQVLS